jgi:hypothetical protein
LTVVELVGASSAAAEEGRVGVGVGVGIGVGVVAEVEVEVEVELEVAVELELAEEVGATLGAARAGVELTVVPSVAVDAPPAASEFLVDAEIKRMLAATR